MRPKILVINGHPDPSATRFCAALAQAYAAGAQRAGAATMIVDLSCNPADGGPLDIGLRDAIAAADAIAIVHPLWTSEAPPLLKQFLELAFGGDAARRVARTIVTMDLPSLFYRAGTGEVPSAARDLIGSVGLINAAERAGWLARVAKSGENDGARLERQARRRERWAAALRPFGRRTARATAPRLEPAFA
jgi:putative NADPH-quinone reductase